MCLFAGNAGNTGLAFLKIGAGSRAAGMGEAFTAVSNDASATYWNPAGLASLENGQVLVTNNRWFQDISNNFAAVNFNIGKTAVGLSYIGTTIGGIEARSNPTTEPLTEIDAHDVMLGLSLARSLSETLQYGVTLKYLYEKIYLESAIGGAIDAGVLYRSPISGLTVGATVQNIGAMSELRNESTRLPITVRTGAAWTQPFASAGSMTFAADAVQVIDGTFHIHAGGEWTVKQFAIRLGYLTGYDDRNLQGGFGFHFGRYQFDYGYAPFGADLGNSHRTSFGIYF